MKKAVSKYNYRWTNYETWLANLWITNDEPMHNLLAHILKECTSVNAKAASLAEAIHELLEAEITHVGLGYDLLKAAQDHIKWVEIIEYSS